MKLNRDYKLERAASTDGTRLAIQNIYIGHEKGPDTPTVAVATNGRIMAIVPVEIADENELGLVSPEALIRARKLAKKNAESELILNGDIRFVDESSLPRPIQEQTGNYPTWQVVAPTAEPKFKIRLDVHLLLALAEALGATNRKPFVTLEMSDELSPIRVTTDGVGRGILMPARA